MKKMFVFLSASTASAFLNIGFAEQYTPTAQSNKTPTPIPQENIAPETQSPVSGTFDITSNYIFRGISNSNNLPAFQGGLTYTFLKTGIYLNIWGSNVSYQTDKSIASLELDTIIGIANDIGEHFHYDINIDRYNYPKATDLNYNEFIANAQFYFLTAQIGFSSNVYGSHANGTYYNVGAKYGIPAKYFFKLNDVTLSGGIGHYALPRDEGLYSYNDYNVQLSKAIGIYNIAIQWTDTSGNTHQGALGGSKIIGTVTATF